jgi:uncharacterized membrane protein YjfL (UPF0719 family)
MAFAIDMILSAVRLLAAMVFSAGALYSGMSLLDRLTQGIDEWKEIKKGNLAFGLLFASVMIATILLVEPRISDILLFIQSDLPAVLTAQLLALMLANYFIGLFLAIVIIYLTINLIDRITPDLDELAELKKGNLAVALVLSLAIVLVIIAVRIPLENVFVLIKNLESTLV